MRKIILIVGVISLIACSDQAYQENRMPNGVVTGTDPKALNNRIKPNTYVPDEYFSPWDINNLLPVQYYFQCHLLSHKSVYVRVTPFIGLAYYDGIDDGTYNMSTGAFNLTSGTYPNLYTGGNEYGNYIAANPIILGLNSYNTHELAVFSDWVTPLSNDHCPVFPTVYNYPFNPSGIYFDLVNNHLIQPLGFSAGTTITPSTGSATVAETNLLAEYGKVMYYKIEFSQDPFVYNNANTFYVLALEDISNVNLYKNSMVVNDMFGGDLYYHSTNAISPTLPSSQEIVVDLNSYFLLI